MIDEGRQTETVSITVGDQVISAHVYSAAHSTEERVFRLIDELYRKAGETPISIARSELVEAVGVCARSISDALSRLRAAARLVSARHGQKTYYQTITQPYQAELVSVAAISSRPPPVTRIEQLTATVHAVGEQPARNRREVGEQPARTREEVGEQPARTREEVGEQPARTRREVGEQPARTRQEVGEQPARTRQEAAEQPARTRQEVAAQPARTRREAAEQPARTRREAAEQPARTRREVAAQPARTREEVAAQPARTREEAAAQITPFSCPRCGPGSMLPTKIKSLQTASLPGTTYYCAGSNRTCSLLWHSTEGIVYEPGQRQLTRDEAAILVQRRLGKPELALPTDGTRQQGGGYLDAYRRRFGQLPWETEEGRRVIAGEIERSTDGSDPEPRACARRPRPARFKY